MHLKTPENLVLAPVVVPGLKYTEQIIYSIVEIVNAFSHCESYNNIIVNIYLQLLLSENTTIAFSAKLALNQVLKPKIRRRRVVIPSPPRCQSPKSKLEKY